MRGRPRRASADKKNNPPTPSITKKITRLPKIDDISQKKMDDKQTVPEKVPEKDQSLAVVQTDEAEMSTTNVTNKSAGNSAETDSGGIASKLAQTQFKIHGRQFADKHL